MENQPKHFFFLWLLFCGNNFATFYCSFLPSSVQLSSTQARKATKKWIYFLFFPPLYFCAIVGWPHLSSFFVVDGFFFITSFLSRQLSKVVHFFGFGVKDNRKVWPTYGWALNLHYIIKAKTCYPPIVSPVQCLFIMQLYGISYQDLILVGRYYTVQYNNNYILNGQ